VPPEQSPVQALLGQRTSREAHEHLLGTCPWYEMAGAGEPVGDPEQHCIRAPDRLVVKMTPRTPEASTVPKPTRPPGGPGLFHIKGRELPPYIQHLWWHLKDKYGEHQAYGMAVGIVKKWKEGVNPGGYTTKSGKGKRTHPDVQAAAAKNIAEWEKDRADAHKQSASSHRDSEHVKAAAPAVTAPGAQPLSGLVQRPATATGPAAPRARHLPMPTAAEVRALAATVPPGNELPKRNLRTFLESAAVKLSKDDSQAALAALRLAQAAVFTAHKDDTGPDPEATAAVWTRVPPAERSSAHAVMQQSRDQAQQYKVLAQKVARLADRIRSNLFPAGIYSGPTTPVRLTGDRPMTAVEHLLKLAGPPAGHDVSEPVTSDTSGQTPLLQVPENLMQIGSDPRSREELAALAALDRTRVTAYLDKARQMLRTNPAGAAQMAARAKAVAAGGGAHHLARHIHHHIEALATQGNREGQGAADAMPPGARNSPDTPSGAVHQLAATLALASAGSTAGAAVHAQAHKILQSHSATRTPAQEHVLHESHVLHLHHVEHLHVQHVEHVAHVEHLHHLTGAGHPAAAAATVKTPGPAGP
jgi:hypothetical protein